MTNDLLRLRGAAGAALAHDTIDLLAAHDIPPTPANYEIWVTHKTGAKPDLSKQIEARLAKGEKFTEETNDELFERYFSNTRLSIQMVETGESIARELAGVVTTLRDAGAQSGAYANTLETAASNFEGGIDPANFHKVLAEIAAVTRDMANHNRELSARMETSSRQVEVLQTTLQSVRVEALTDGLTGLANRRMFDENLRKRLQEANAGLGELCLLLCDIDHFKQFNDSWGHLVGDQVIRFIAHTLRDYAKGDALAARYGGEEFAIIMPRASLHEAQKIGAAIRQEVRSKRLTRKSTGENIGAVTLSFGIAKHRNGESMDSLIGRADACLYASKRGGRDRVTTDVEFSQQSAA